MRFASSKKPRESAERSYPADRATSLTLSAGVSLPECWNSMSGNCSTARRRDCSQLEWIRFRSLSPADTLRYRVISRLSFLYSNRSKGGPTVTFERMVASSDRRAYFAATSKEVVGWMPRSRIGRPYLHSPSCKYKESSVAARGFPCG